MHFLLEDQEECLTEEKKYLISLCNRSYSIDTYHMAKQADISKCQDHGWFSSCIPYGSLNFVREVLSLQVPKEKRKSRNIQLLRPFPLPWQISTYYKRWVKAYPWKRLMDDKTEREKLEKAFCDCGGLFVKNVSVLKNMEVQRFSSLRSFMEEMERKDADGGLLHPGYDKYTYAFSIPLEFISEWRIFVYEDEVRDMRIYNFGKNGHLYTPDRWEIFSIIREMGRLRMEGREIPAAYTIDVGVDTNGNTYLLEIHNFVSCGDYGFEDKCIRDMLVNAYELEKKRVM